MPNDKPLMPGWYLRPDMYETVCFWDGNAWTDQLAPARFAAADPSVFTIAVGVALGSFITAIAALILAAAFGYGG